MATQGVLGQATLKEFEEGLHGELVARGDSGYDEARALWNGAHDAHPALIARCHDADDVRHAIGFARSEGLEVAVRGGGHSIPGFSSVEDGLMIDLSPLKSIEIDPQARTARVGAGVTWAELDAATQEHGLAVTGGLVSSTGVAGFTLGGGIGWLMRQHGLACDNLRRAELVTADGRAVIAGAGDDPELLWGLRGGGGNFGVVTSFEFDLHPVGPTVNAGVVFYDGARAAEVLRFYREYVRELPDELTTLVNLLTAPPAPFLPEEWHGRKLVALIGVYAGEVEQGAAAMAPMKALGDPVADLMGPMPYVQMQGLIDALWPKGTQAYMKAGYMNELGDAAIEAFGRFHQGATSPASEIHIQHLGGAVARNGETSAFGERDSKFVLNVCAVSHDGSEFDQHVGWAQETYRGLEPWLTGGVYVNFLSEEGAERVRAAYGEEKFARLQALKDRFDPTNLFHRNQNVPPTT
ncbi:MAG TPA: FAD-binding oxidoreductase [Solirubrobacterales bacterium]